MTGAFAFLRPLALIAAVAFLAGFVGYLAVGQPSPAVAQTGLKAAVETSGPASDDWNLPKHI
jgi:hypothetical protein